MLKRAPQAGGYLPIGLLIFGLMLPLTGAVPLLLPRDAPLCGASAAALRRRRAAHQRADPAHDHGRCPPCRHIRRAGDACSRTVADLPERWLAAFWLVAGL